MADQEIQLSAAEKRLLGRTFRRHAAPYLVIAAATTLWALSWGRIEATAQVPDEAPVASVAADPAFRELAGRLDRAQAELRDLAARGGRGAGEAGSDLARQLAAMEQRAANAEQRLRELERRSENASEGSGAGNAELANLQDRLQRVESRQDKVERAATAVDADAAAVHRAVLDRLHNLEERLTALEAGAGGAPPR